MKEFEARRPELRVADAFRAESHGVVADDIGARLQILLAAIRLPQALRQPVDADLPGWATPSLRVD